MEDYDLLPFFEQITNETFDIVPDDIKYENVLERLKKTEINILCGVEKLNPALPKDCASAFAIPLFLIFKESLEKSQLPLQFMSAILTPRHKKERKELTRKL